MPFVVYDDPDGTQEAFAVCHRAAQAWGDTLRGLLVVRTGLCLVLDGLRTALACPEEESQEHLEEQLEQIERQFERVELQIDAARLHQQDFARLARDAQARLAAVVDANLAA
jgi:hypothetical protein